jgi:hypothetical protein
MSRGALLFRIKSAPHTSTPSRVKWSEDRQTALTAPRSPARVTRGTNHRYHRMARLAAAGVFATPEQTEESEERSPSGAGAMATNDASSSARQHELGSDDILVDNTANTGAMGQIESREDIRSRNAAIRRAGSQAVIPRSRTGRLPRRSGLGSQVVTGQRRLGNNVLANARTYDVPSDEDSRPRKKQAANKSAFSPLKRQTKQPHRAVETWRAEQEQIALDLQLGGDEAEENTENLREESRADVTDNNDVGEDDGADMDAGIADSAVDHIQQIEAPKKKRGRPSKQRESVRQDPPPRVPVELVAEPVQQNSVPKRKVGRPSKQREPNRQDPLPHVAVEPVDEPVQQSHAPKRKRGRAEVEVVQPATPDALPVQSSPGRPTRSVARSVRPANHREAAEITVAGPSRLERPSRTRAPESGTVHPASRRQPRQPPSEPVTRTTAEPIEQVPVEHAAVEVEEAEVIRPDELEGINDPDYNDQPDGADAQPDDDVDGTDEGEGSEDDEEEQDDGDDEHVDETEIQVEPLAADRHRLYGYWHKIRDVMREVAKHRGNMVRTKDDEFKEILQACRDATNNVRTIPVDVSPDELNRIVLECREALVRARVLCGDREPLGNSRENRKRGFHVFKHLLPALAKLLRAAVKAFERVDFVGTGTEQISVDHLHIVLGLLFAVVDLGENAHRGYLELSKPIKQDVHNGITIPLRELHTDLSRRYQALVRDRERKERDEEIAREFAAMEEGREQQAQRRQLEIRNQDKWKRMNQVRQNISFNSGNVKKMNHLRSCPMGLVHTDADGQPFLPDELRDRRGEWSMREIEALQKGLQKHVDTPAPLRSSVFENIIAEHCPFRKELTNKNLLEIVIKANEMKNFFIQRSRERGTDVEEWVRKIPRWMDPPRPAPAGENSAQGVIELD